jgi:sugar-specific transcriptional regulator TrmB
VLIRDEDVKTLNWLGLTERQAKVYLALLQLGSSGAEAISRLSGVHRQEVYRVAARLQELGFVETNLASPTHFTAIPVEKALKAMIKRKTKELAKVQIHTANIIERYSKNDLLYSQSTDKPYFTIVSGNDCLRKMQNALESSIESIKVVATFKRFCQAFSIHEDLLKVSLKNHVRIQVVTEQLETESLPKWVQQLLLEKLADFELRTAPRDVQTTVVIYDDVRLCLAINILSDIVRGSQLWSNSESLIALSKEYFENVWAQSKTYLI